MSQPRRRLCALILAGLAGVALHTTIRAARAANLSALPPVIGVTELFALDDLSGVALYGFDPVSYFLGEGPKAGLAEHEVMWSGVAWRFASPANKEAFLDDPDAYAPRFGGYDATAVAKGLTVRANPWLSVVRPDGLYLFRSDHGRARFMTDETIAEQAEERWAHLKPALVQP
jgi:YHS domain-containing protein